MSNFIKNNKKTLLLVVIIIIVLLGIFIYHRIMSREDNVYDNDYGNKEPMTGVRTYDDNEYQIVKIEPSDVYIAYFKRFMKLLAYDPVAAYEKLSVEAKQNDYNNSYDNFYKYTQELDRKSLLTADVSRYSADDDRIIIIDTTNVSYIFYENGVWNYTVRIMGNID